MSHNSNNFNIPGYDAYHIVRNNKKGGGVACYVKQELTSKSMVVDDVFECTTIEIQVSGYRNIIVNRISRSPGSDVTVFSEHVKQLFLELSLRKSMFLCGDFNIDILKHNSNRGSKYFLDTMYAIGLYPLIDRPTRISNQSFSLIDNIFTNVTNYNITSGILINDITDHLPVFAICTYPNPNRLIKKLYIKTHC